MTQLENGALSSWPVLTKQFIPLLTTSLKAAHYSSWISLLPEVQSRVSHRQSERLEVSPCAENNNNKQQRHPCWWIVRGYIWPSEDLTLNLPVAFCCWIRPLTHLKVDFIADSAHSAVLNPPISGKDLPCQTGVIISNTETTPVQLGAHRPGTMQWKAS